MTFRIRLLSKIRNYLKLTLYLYMEFLDCVWYGQFSWRWQSTRKQTIWL